MSDTLRLASVNVNGIRAAYRKGMGDWLEHRGIDVLAMTPGRKLMVFGDMGEIGDRIAQYHDEIGGYAKSQGIDRLFTLGEYAGVAARNFGEGGRHFGDLDALLVALRSQLAPDTVVLVKGSRFMKMERVVDAVAAQE